VTANGEPELAEDERRFRRAGLPLLIEGYTARDYVFTRAAPFLLVTFALQCANGVDEKLSWEWNVFAVLAGIAILVTAFGLVNWWQERPFFSLPERIGLAELAAYVLIPALPALVVNGNALEAVIVVAGQLVVLALVAVVVGFGLISIVLWSTVTLLEALGRSFAQLTRILPLIIFLSIWLFVSSDIWTALSVLETENFFALGVVVGVLAIGVLLIRLPSEVGRVLRDLGVEPALRRVQRFNLSLVLALAQMLQVTVVGGVLFLLSMLIGVLLVGPDLTEAWTGGKGEVLISDTVIGLHLYVTVELLGVSLMVAGVTALYYATSLVTDADYREDFLDQIEGRLAPVFKARVGYLERLAHAPGSATR
jgi:hypothetical protein